MVGVRKISKKKSKKSRKSPSKPGKKAVGVRRKSLKMQGFATGNVRSQEGRRTRSKKRILAPKTLTVWPEYPKKTRFVPKIVEKPPKRVKKATKTRRPNAKVTPELIAAAVAAPSIISAATLLGSYKIARRVRLGEGRRATQKLDLQARWARAVADVLKELQAAPSRVKRPVSAAEVLHSLRVRPCPSLRSVSKIMTSLPKGTRLNFSKDHFKPQRTSS